MRASLAVIAGVLLMNIAGCAPRYTVHTVTAEGAPLASLRTFVVLRTPRARDGRPRTSPYDPMVANSITNGALRQTITNAFASRGYMLDERQPDFAVAVYASAHEELDPSAWDYGYPAWPRWPSPQQRTPQATFTAGTVVVDVVNPNTRELLWRGSGSSRMAEDPAADTRELQRIAAQIVEQFPRAAERRLATRR